MIGRAGAKRLVSFSVAACLLTACGSAVNDSKIGSVDPLLRNVSSAEVADLPVPTLIDQAPVTTSSARAVPKPPLVSRVLFVGDSLMYGAYPSLQYIGAGRNVQTRYVGFTGTGLLSGQGWWLPAISKEVEDFAPQVVVLESCCNYGLDGPLFRTADGMEVQPDSEAMFRAWAKNTAEAAKRAAAGGARVMWALTPDPSWLVTDKYQTRIRRFNDMYRQIGVPLIDWQAALEPDGEFASAIAVDGKVVPVRRDDGLHLTPAGSLVVARATWAAIDDGSM